MVFDLSFRMDHFSWARFLSKTFRHFVSAISEQERTMVLSVHADGLRGGNYKSLLLNTVLLLATDSILLFSFER